MTTAISQKSALNVAPFDYLVHHRRIFAHSAVNNQLWTDLHQRDQNRLSETHKDYNRCKDAMLIKEDRSSRIGKLSALVEKSAYLILFGYQLANHLANPSDKNFLEVCATGFHVALTGLGISNTLISYIPYLPNSLPKIASHALNLMGIGAQLTDLTLNQNRSVTSYAEQKMRAAQFASKEHLRLSAAEIDTLDKFAKQANEDENENHRMLLEIFRGIKSAKK